MSKYKVEVNASPNQAPAAENPAAQDSELSNKVVIGAVIVGAAIFETALIPGILIGAAASLAPQYFPKLEKRIQPLFSSSIRGVYKLGRKARTVVGDIQEHIGDIAAEVHAEEAAKASEPTKAVDSSAT